MGGQTGEKQILIYNNSTGAADVMEPLCEGAGIKVLRAKTKGQLLAGVEQGAVKLLLIDIDLDQYGMISNVELVTGLRKRSRIPIVVVSGQMSETAKIMMLNAGADDYVTSDCNPMELLARVKCQLRRYMQLAGKKPEPEECIYKIDELEIDDSQRKVTVEGREVRLTPIEYKILRLLAKEKGRVWSIDQIYETIWHMQAIGADNTIAVHIRHIREKIESNPAQPRYLKVVWGTGYKIG